MATLLRSSFRLANFARNERLRTHVARPIVCRSVHAIKKNDTMTPAREDGESDDEYRKRLEKWFADDDPNSPKVDGFDEVECFHLRQSISCVASVSRNHTYAAPSNQCMPCNCNL